jgi:hypothetical protein
MDVSVLPSFPPSSIALHIFSFQPTPNRNCQQRDSPRRSCGSRRPFLRSVRSHLLAWAERPPDQLVYAAKAQAEHAYVSTVAPPYWKHVGKAR